MAKGGSKTGAVPADNGAGTGVNQEDLGFLGNLDLSVLSPGHPLRLTRTWPLFCEGYLTGLEVPPGGIEGILEVVKTTYGGGQYRLQNTQQVPNGSIQFASGHVTFKIAGNPVSNGREYAPDGTPVASAPTPVGPPTMFMPHPPAAGPNQTENRMLGMLQGALERATVGGSGADLGGVVKAIKEMREMVPAPAEPMDQFSQFDRFLGMMGKMQRLNAPAADAGAAEGGGMFGGGMMEQMLIAKFMGMGGPQQNQPPVVPHPPQGYNGAPPTHGQYPGHPQQPGPGPGQPHTQPQQPQPNPPPPAQAPSPPPAAAEASSDNDDDNDYEPITPDDVVEQIKSMSTDAEQMAFMSSVLKGLGFANGLDGLTPQSNGVDPGVDISGMYAGASPPPTQ